MEGSSSIKVVWDPTSHRCFTLLLSTKAMGLDLDMAGDWSQPRCSRLDGAGRRRSVLK